MSGVSHVRGISRKQNSLWLLALLVISACQSAPNSNDAAPREIYTPTYDLIIPDEQKALLILFPCFPCDAADTRSESPKAGSVVMDYL